MSYFKEYTDLLEMLIFIMEKLLQKYTCRIFIDHKVIRFIFKKLKLL